MQTAELAASLRSAVGLLHKGLRRQVSTAGLYSMTEMETIHHLFRASALPSELAALTRITTQSMSQILVKLEGNGLIKRTPSKEDGRPTRGAHSAPQTRVNALMALRGSRAEERTSTSG